MGEDTPHRPLKHRDNETHHRRENEEEAATLLLILDLQGEPSAARFRGDECLPFPSKAIPKMAFEQFILRLYKIQIKEMFIWHANPSENVYCIQLFILTSGKAGHFVSPYDDFVCLLDIRCVYNCCSSLYL